MAEKKYYWLKLKRDFFKRHDIRIIEGMPNGKDYVLFYLKLLVESIDHNGQLRFSDTIPYNEPMLATITDTNVDIVRSAMEILKQLNLVEILDDSTIYISEVDKMIGSASQDERQLASHRERQKKYRDKQKASLCCHDDVIRDGEIDKEIDIEKDINTYIPPKITSKFVKPTVDEVRNYIVERNYHFDAETFVAFYESKGWMVGKSPMKSWKACCTTWESNRKGVKTTGGNVKANGFHNFEERSNNLDDDVMDRFNKLMEGL